MQFPLFFRTYSRIILLVLACTVFMLAFSDILVAIGSQWTGADSAGSNHGPLVLLCTLYLLFRKRKQLGTLEADPQKIGFVALVLLGIIIFLAELTKIQAVQMVAMPLLILTSIYVILGKQHLKLVLLPVLILIFALPIWKPVLPVLQDITTWVTEFNLAVLGRPAHVVGNYVYVTGGAFFIEESCSGLRYLLIAIILSLINSDLNSHNIKQSTTLLLVAVGLAFFANWVRVLVIIVIGDLTNMQSGLVKDHGNFGWALFLFIVLIPYLLISSFLVPAQESINDKSGSRNTNVAYAPQYYLIWMFLIISLPLLRHGQQFISAGSSDGEIKVPTQLTNWVGNNALLGDGWKPDYKNATREIFKSYSADSGAIVKLNISHYAEQSQGAELINAENVIADGKSWTVLPSTERQYTVTGIDDLYGVNTVEIINNSKEKQLIWYWYDIGGHATSNQYYAKLFQILAQLEGNNYASLIAISIMCEDECTDRKLDLEDYFLGWRAIDN